MEDVIPAARSRSAAGPLPNCLEMSKIRHLRGLLTPQWSFSGSFVSYPLFSFHPTMPNVPTLPNNVEGPLQSLERSTDNYA